jgi:hypothetical protein
MRACTDTRRAKRRAGRHGRCAAQRSAHASSRACGFRDEDRTAAAKRPSALARGYIGGVPLCGIDRVALADLRALVQDPQG